MFSGLWMKTSPRPCWHAVKICRAAVSRIASDFLTFDFAGYFFSKCLFESAFCGVARMVPLNTLADSKFLRHDCLTAWTWPAPLIRYHSRPDGPAVKRVSKCWAVERVNFVPESPVHAKRVSAGFMPAVEVVSFALGTFRGQGNRAASAMSRMSTAEIPGVPSGIG